MSEAIEERIARIEGALGIGFQEQRLTVAMEWVACGFVATGCVLGLLGAGAPNHYYQVLFSLLCVALGYHRGWFLYTSRVISNVLALMNVLLLSVFLKIFLGAGSVQPFAWIRVPSISTATEESSKFMPDFSLNWQAVSAAELSIDLTVVQSFLLLVSLAGGLFGFQPFASFAAFALVIISVPTLLIVEWNLVLLSLVVGILGMYLQSGTPGRRTTSL